MTRFGKIFAMATLAFCVSFTAGETVFATELENSSTTTISGVDVTKYRGQNSLVLPSLAVTVLAADNQTDTEITEKTEEEMKEEILAGYTNLGIVVVTNYLNVREEASTSATIVGKMVNDDACEILAFTEDGAWCQIVSGDVEGYISAEYLLTGEEARERAMEVLTLQATIVGDCVNVRTEASTDSSIWTQVSSQERYEVVQELDGWVEIELDSSTGFISTEFVEVNFGLNQAISYIYSSDGTSQSLRNQIVSYAMQFLGNPYVWGGESLTSGVDCSGFTMKVYQNFGIYLSHYTGSQAVEGKSISRSELQPGDLVFYAQNGSINHVALYIGNGQVIHARNSKYGIAISNIDYRTPVKYVNVLGS